MEKIFLQYTYRILFLVTDDPFMIGLVKSFETFWKPVAIWYQTATAQAEVTDV